MLPYPSMRNCSLQANNGQASTTSLDISTTSRHSVAARLPALDHRVISLYCFNCGYKHVIQLRCGRRSCPVCRKSHYSRLLRGYLELAKIMRAPKLLTLTTTPKETLTSDRLRELRRAFQRLLHRKYFRDRIRGGLYVIEVKRGAMGWNLHLHALIDAAYLEQAIVSAVWRELTGDSYVVDVRQAHAPAGGLRYILKYLLKPPALNGQEAVYDCALKATRLVQTFGTAYRARLEKRPLTCPACGSRDWLSEFGLRWLSDSEGRGERAYHSRVVSIAGVRQLGYS